MSRREDEEAFDLFMLMTHGKDANASPFDCNPRLSPSAAGPSGRLLRGREMGFMESGGRSGGRLFPRAGGHGCFHPARMVSDSACEHPRRTAGSPSPPAERPSNWATRAPLCILTRKWFPDPSAATMTAQIPSRSPYVQAPLPSPVPDQPALPSSRWSGELLSMALGILMPFGFARADDAEYEFFGSS
jgi:hypothetical protein